MYLNLVPHENIDPPLTTGASEALGNLRENFFTLQLFYMNTYILLPHHACLFGRINIRKFLAIFCKDYFFIYTVEEEYQETPVVVAVVAVVGNAIIVFLLFLLPC